MGRHKSETRKDKLVAFRMYQDDFEAIKNFANAQNMSFTDFLTELVKREIVLNS